MIYIDSSVALAYLLAESRAPSAQFLKSLLVSSRLLEYEVWTRLHARRLGERIDSNTHALLSGIQLVEMSRNFLNRALAPWPVGVRTLDALHLATVEYLRTHGESVELASYDTRMLAAARTLGIPIVDL